MSQSQQTHRQPSPVVVTRDDFPQLFGALRARGFQIVGPAVREEAIVYDELAGVDDLPIGFTDEQEAGTYRLKRREDDALFGYNVGPQSWKRFLHPPRLQLLRAERTPQGTSIEATVDPAPRLAFLGVRACELAAIGIQDRVFLGGQFVDPDYRQRRERVCIIAVGCGQAASTCFCASMGTGPRIHGDVDLSLVEVLEAGRHDFLFEAGSPLGRELLDAIPSRPATESDILATDAILQATEENMGRRLRTDGIVELLKGQPEHPRWSEVATRCLSCANCTMVCPTCFCTSVVDSTDLSGTVAERWRQWDSCFTLDFSHISGGTIRASTRSRYRQWLTHKLATWVDQFGTSGCVGCGRCITWCPVGIDITAEVRAIQDGTDSGLDPEAREEGQQ